MHFSIQTFVSWICGLLTSLEIGFIILGHLIILLFLSFCLCVCRVYAVDPPETQKSPGTKLWVTVLGIGLISLGYICSFQVSR